jgi:hypothetical protein
LAASPTSQRAFLSGLIVSIAIRDIAVANRDTADSRDSVRVGDDRKRIPHNYTKKFFAAPSTPRRCDSDTRVTLTRVENLFSSASRRGAQAREKSAFHGHFSHRRKIRGEISRRTQ